MGLPFFPVIGVYDLGGLRQPTSSNPHFLKVQVREGASLWVGKCCWICSDPYTVLKEYVCYRLAKILDLPVLDCQIVKDGARFWFAVPFIKQIDNFLDRFFLGSENADIIPGMLAFNILVANTDQHEDNILLERISDDPLKHRMWMIDFSHALYERGRATLPQDLTVYDCLPLDVANGVITGMHNFEPFLKKLSFIDSNEIVEVVESIPKELIKPEYEVARDELAKFIIDRQRNLEDMLKSAKIYFPNWR